MINLETPILYINSVIIPIIKYEGRAGHPCFSDTWRGSLEVCENLDDKDKQAKELLDKNGIKYKLIDLSGCPLRIRLKAKITGINETPTLILNGEKIKGIENIKRAVQIIHNKPII